jgi:putative glycosyltransferase
MKISVVTTLYYSAPYMEEFYRRILPCISKISDDYEIIFVNDGSPDNALNIALHLKENDKNIRIIDLSRNFGHHRAIMTGLEFSRGDYIFLLDVDLEEEPELLNVFWEFMQEQKETDVVYGVQTKRKGGLFEKISGALFFDLFNFFSDIQIKKNLILARLMNRQYVDELIKFRERELVFVGIAELTGFRQRALEIKKHSKGKSTYNFGRKLNLAINFIASFSSKPLVYIFYLGIIITFLSFLMISYVIIRKVFFGILEGWTTLIASIWFIGGITIFSVGVLGIYLSKIFIEVKQRPSVIIRNIYE